MAEQPADYGKVHSIELAFNDEDHQHKKTFFYAGTTSGWIADNQGLLLSIAAVICVIFSSFLIGFAYVVVHNDDTFDDEDCWPDSCPSEGNDNSSDSLPTDFYWEPYFPSDSSASSEWGFRLPSPTNRNLYAITHFIHEIFDARFIAVGEDSTLLLSVNGTNWNLLAPIEPQIDLISVKYAAETFFVEGKDGDKYSSHNLRDWSPSEHSFSTGIASDGVISVGVEENTAWRQDLSMAWSSVYLPDADTLHDISYGNGHFIVVGTTHFSQQPDSQYGCVWLSENGASWDLYLISDEILRNPGRLQISLAPTTGERGVFLLFADVLYTSGTGMAWVEIPQSTWVSGSAPSSLSCAILGYCVALSKGSEETVLSQSTDYGQTWTSTIISGELFEIVDNNLATFTSVGSAGSIIQGITNGSNLRGIEWEKVAPEYGEPISSILFAENKFLASSQSFATFESDNGEDWVKHNSPSMSFVAHGDATYVGAFANSRELNIYQSPSTSDNEWEVSSSVEGFYEISSLLFDGHQFALLGRSCDGCFGFDDDDDDSDESYSGILLSSPDGGDWDANDISSTDSFFLDMVWSSVDNCYYAASFGGAIYYTEDFANGWDPKFQLDDANCLSVAVNQQNGMAMAVCRDLNDIPIILKSIDGGQVWNEVSCDCAICQYVDLVRYNYERDMFFLGGSDVLSYDGTTFQQASTNPVSLSSADSFAFGNGVFMILSDLAIVSSTFDQIDFKSC